MYIFSRFRLLQATINIYSETGCSRNHNLHGNTAVQILNEEPSEFRILKKRLYNLCTLLEISLFHASGRLTIYVCTTLAIKIPRHLQNFHDNCTYFFLSTGRATQVFRPQSPPRIPRIMFMPSCIFHQSNSL